MENQTPIAIDGLVPPAPLAPPVAPAESGASMMAQTTPEPAMTAPAENAMQPAAEAAHPAEGEAAHGTAEGELHTSTEAHGGEHSGVFPPFDPSSFGTQLIWLAIAFAFLYIMMSRLALPRIGGIIADRKARIDGDLAAADASRQKTDAAIAAYEAALAAARQKSQAIAEETRAGIKADIDGKRKTVETSLAQKLSEAEARIQVTKTEALGHVGEIAADTVRALVEQLTGPVSAAEAKKAVTAAAKE